MSRLSIELTPEQHRAIKAKAALEGMNIKDFVLEKLFTKPRAKKAAEPEEAEDPCPLCEADGGKHKKFNKRTEKALMESRKGIGLTYHDNLEDYFASFRGKAK